MVKKQEDKFNIKEIERIKNDLKILSSKVLEQFLKFQKTRTKSKQLQAKQIKNCLSILKYFLANKSFDADFLIEEIRKDLNWNRGKIRFCLKQLLFANVLKAKKVGKDEIVYTLNV